MKIEFKANNKRIAKAYFREDYEEKDGIRTDFYMIITPLEEKSYYLRETNNEIFITGEDGLCMINKKQKSLSQKKELKLMMLNH